MARQTRPLTPAEAVRQGRKLIAEQRRQEAARKAANPLTTAWEGGAESDAGKPVPEQDQRVEVVTSEVAQNRKLTRNACPNAAPSVAPRVIPGHDKTGENYSDPIPQAPAMSVFPASSEAAKRDTHADGAWPLTDLRTRQCRFACTADEAPRDQHRFCGRPTRIGRSNLHGSWCDEHLPLVWSGAKTAGGRSMADAERERGVA